MSSRQDSLHRLRGILFMLASVFVFSIMDASMKRLSSHYEPLQIACLRSLSSLLCLIPAIAWQGSWRRLRPTRPALHVLRGFLGMGMLTSFVFAVHRLTMAQTYSLYLTAPLLMTALSVPILGEQVTARRWGVIACGLGGVLVILQPWNKGPFPLAAAAAAACATLCYAVSALTVRTLGPGNSSVSMVFWYLTLVGVLSGLLGVFSWQPVQSGDWLWLAAVGVSGALGQWGLTEAFRRAPPSVVAPFEYTAIVWALLIDWVFWSASPSVSLLLGAAIVVGSGILIILDEHRLAGQAMSTAVPPP